jgi:NADH-quinone oxidoreductase subunit E
MKNNKYCKKILITVRCTLYIVHLQNKKMSETIAFKPETLEKVKQIIARYPEGNKNLL